MSEIEVDPVERRDDERRVQREVVLPAGSEEVWEAITHEAGLREWLAPEVEIDPEPGGELRVRDGEDERLGTVELVEEGSRLCFTWEREGGERSLVELTLEPAIGGTRLRVVERIPAGPTALASAALAGGSWRRRLAALELALGALVLA